MLNINLRPNNLLILYFAERMGLRSYLQTRWTWGKLLSTLPMSNVTLTARTWYLTGTRYFYFLNSWSQQPSQRGQQLSLWRLKLLRIQQKRSCHLPVVFTKELPSLRTQLGWSRIPQAPTGTNTTALPQPQQWAPKKTYALTRQRVSGKMGTRWAGSQPCPSPRYAVLGTCCMC